MFGGVAAVVGCDSGGMCTSMTGNGSPGGNMTVTWLTDDPWPTVLPGVPS